MVACFLLPQSCPHTPDLLHGPMLLPSHYFDATFQTVSCSLWDSGSWIGSSLLWYNIAWSSTWWHHPLLTVGHDTSAFEDHSSPPHLPSWRSSFWKAGSVMSFLMQSWQHMTLPLFRREFLSSKWLYFLCLCSSLVARPSLSSIASELWQRAPDNGWSWGPLFL